MCIVSMLGQMVVGKCVDVDYNQVYFKDDDA